jgi:hypothetical protein
VNKPHYELFIFRPFVAHGLAYGMGYVAVNRSRDRIEARNSLSGYRQIQNDRVGLMRSPVDAFEEDDIDIEAYSREAWLTPDRRVEMKRRPVY